ncbi:Transmembrane ascorbate-dependent reductase CYB561 [Euphorbia peplus]|nr:Transmembrane ascorbate-dependent reductase CYB561 [Euphorbia peplus]
MVALILLARIAGLVVAGLVLFWALVFQSSFVPHHSSNSSFHQDLIYALLHPLLMVIGLIIISGEAILVHRWLPGSGNMKKTVHLSLQGVALCCGIFGIWSKFQTPKGLVANFYTLHSWMGLFCISLFAAQWVMGFMSFWQRGEKRRVRQKILPWHVFVGLYTYGLAVATAETGLLEKLTFLQMKSSAATKRSPESMLVNSIGVGLALLCGMVIFAAVSPKQQLIHAPLSCKLMYSQSNSFSS